MRSVKFLAVLAVTTMLFTTQCSRNNLGDFEDHGDIGAISIPGAAQYNASDGTYLVAGSGENMWFDEDALHYVWKRMTGDVVLAANIKFVGTGGNPHRKAGLIIRQDLEPDSRYADAIIHGDGLTSIQYREEKGGPTREIQSNVKGPARIRIEKEGDYVSMSVAAEGEELHPAGGTFKIKFNEPYYIGLGVCAHDSTVIEQAIFSDVAIENPDTTGYDEPVLESTLETINVNSKDRRVVYHTRGHIEAPNWSRDGNTLIFNSEGKLYSIPVTGGTPKLIDTGFAIKCNNDHGLSPDGGQIAISDQSKDGKSLIYIVPATGGTPKQITPEGPSYWHGWSPNGRTLAFCGERNGQYDIYTIPARGGKETRLTNAPGLDDGPDYSPDGQYIYFNSVRTGTMQVWRMKNDGSEQTQITQDEYNDWFPHPSPDGKNIVFVSYDKGVEGHPANKDVMLRMMPVDGGQVDVLAKLFGGQGTINVPSWSPDSQNVAFVSYRLVYSK